MKKNIYALGMLLLIIALIVPVYGDVDVNVNTTEDIHIVAYADGSISIVCNGVDVLSKISSLSTNVNQLSYFVNKVHLENQQLENDLTLLVSELEGVLDNLYGRTAFLADIIGVTANDTVTQQFLESNQTIIENLASTWNKLSQVDTHIVQLTNSISDLDSQTTTELSNQEAQINQIKSDVAELQDETVGILDYLDETTEAINALIKDNNTLANQIEVLARNQGILKNETDKQYAILGEYESAILQLQQNQNALNGELEQLETELIALHKENSEANSKTTQLSWVSFGAIGVAVVSVMVLMARHKKLEAKATEDED